MLKGDASGSVTGWSVLRCIKTLLCMDWMVRLSHVHREANRCTDAPANLGCDPAVSWVEFSSPPADLSQELLADLRGVSTMRLVCL